MFIQSASLEVEEDEPKILESGLRAITRMTKDEFEGLKLILKILREGGELNA